MSSFAGKYLNAASAKEYLNRLAEGVPSQAKMALLSLYIGIEDPRILSVGGGGGEELLVLKNMFPNGTVVGLDVSQKALQAAREYLQSRETRVVLVEGDATQMQFADETFEGIVMSALLHEVYSYTPNGREAWKSAIREVARKLTPDGVFLLRDFAAPNSNEPMTLTAKTSFARRFYSYFRQYYRRFVGWQGEVDKRKSTKDFPTLNRDFSVELPVGKIAEVLLHFRNCMEDGGEVLLVPGWKEINETYLPLDEKGEVIPTPKYVDRVLLSANEALADTDFQLVCLERIWSHRIEAAKLLSDHFTITCSHMFSEQVLLGLTGKMELVFKKVRKEVTE